MKTVTAGVFTRTGDAEAAINDLRAAGIADDRISFVYRNPEGEVESHEAHEALEVGADKAKGAGSGAVSGAATGGVVGALAGLAVANGILPGLGTLFVAGPLAAALGLTGAAATTAAGAMTGAAAGGIIGALTGLGISETDAHLYEDRVRDGNVLVVAESNEAGLSSIFAKHGAEEIREHARE